MKEQSGYGLERVITIGTQTPLTNAETQQSAMKGWTRQRRLRKNTICGLIDGGEITILYLNQQ